MDKADDQSVQLMLGEVRTEADKELTQYFITDDPTLNATGKLLAELHNGLLASQAELLATKQEVQDSAGTESEQKKALTQQVLLQEI